jgi:hypothetical protein
MNILLNYICSHYNCSICGLDRQSHGKASPNIIDRKNFLFSFAENGAESSAMYFSLQQTARANSLDPEKYVAKAIELAAFMDPAKDDYSALPPWNLGKEYDLS